MLAERDSVLSRAAKHAALSDPARLAVVDALAWGDRSPRELQDQFGLASNLLAHHVKVLENAGIVVRRRSEGDRRRSYLQLVPGSLESLVSAPGAGPAVSRIVFVCTANSARSQLAAALWRRASRVPVSSAGTHPSDRVDPGAVAVARRHGLALRVRKPRNLREVVTSEDLLITVCDHAHEELTGTAAMHWSVPDPVLVGTVAAFDAAFDEITRRITGLAPVLAPATDSEEGQL